MNTDENEKKFFTDAPVLLCYVENALIETKFAFRKNERKFSERKTLKGSRRMVFKKRRRMRKKEKKNHEVETRTNFPSFYHVAPFQVRSEVGRGH